MAKCLACGTEFDVEDARDEYNAVTEFGELDYDADFLGASPCTNCAVSEASSNYGRGGEILALMNGDDDDDW